MVVRGAPLVERERELELLGRLVASARGGVGGAIVLEGPPGIGKSSLLAAARAGADDLRVVTARGGELEHEFPFGIVRQLLEPVFVAADDGDRRALLAGAGALAEPVLSAPDSNAGAEPPFSALHGLYWFAVNLATARPVLAVVDDLQWADLASLRWLVYLARRLEGLPLGLLLAGRPAEPGAARDLLDELVANPDVELLQPAVLSEQAAGAMAAVVLGVEPDREFIAACHAATGGNPFLLRELFGELFRRGVAPSRENAGVASQLSSQGVGRAVRGRLRRLGAESTALARAVAVLGDPVELTLAAGLAGLDVDVASEAADRLADASILGPGRPLGFVHALVRSSVEAELSAGERAAAHERAAALLAQTSAAADRVALHLLATSPRADPVTVETLRAAAAGASGRGAPEAAVAFLERALREPPSDPERAEVLAQLGRAQALAGRRDAIPHFEAAIGLQEDPGKRARLRLELGRVLHDFGRPADACELLEQGLADVGLEDRELSVALEAQYLTSATLLPDRAADCHLRVDAILARDDDAMSSSERTLVSKAINVRLYAGGTREQLVPIARGLFADGRLIDEDGVGSPALGHVVNTLSFCDEYATAEEALALALVHVRRRGSVTWFAACNQLRARQRVWTGPIGDAVEEARSAFETFAGGQQLYLPAAACVLVRALLEADKPDEAESVLARLDRGAAPVGPFAAWRQEAIGRVAAYRGDHARALEAMLACGERATAVLITNPSLFHWRSEAGLAALRLDRHELARGLIEEERDLAERFGAPRAIGVARRAAGALERGEDAVKLLRSAADVLAGCGAHVEHARTLVELGMAVRRAGRRAEARGPLRDALDLARSCGADAVAARAHEELVAAGARPRRDPTESRTQLTASELRVARMAAEGMTNREIAQALFLTENTIQTHLRNAFRKLNIGSRSQLARAL